MAFRNIRHKFQYRMHEDMRKGAFLYEYPLKQPALSPCRDPPYATVGKTPSPRRYIRTGYPKCRAYRQGAAHASVSNIFAVKHSLVKKLYIYPVKILFTNLLFPVQRCPRSRDILFLA